VRTLGVAAGAGLVFGLASLDAAAEGEAEEPQKPPSWLGDALAEMKRTRCVGVALVVAEDEKGRATLRDRLAALLAEPPYDVQEHLVEAVWVCARAKFVGAKDGETAVLLDADGRRVEGAAFDLSSDDAFVRSARALLRSGTRLADRAKAARTEEVARWIERLASEDETTRDNAWEKLLDAFPKARAAILHALAGNADSADPKRGSATWYLRRLVEFAYLNAAAAAHRGHVTILPFGASWAYAQPSEDAPDPCPTCGRGVISDTTRVLLEILTKDPKRK
jgi:hypothetical protein